MDFGNSETRGVRMRAILTFLSATALVWTFLCPEPEAKTLHSSLMCIDEEYAVAPVGSPTPPQKPERGPSAASKKTAPSPTPSPTPTPNPPKKNPERNREFNQDDSAAPPLARSIRGIYQLDLSKSDDPQELLHRTLKELRHEARVLAYNEVASKLETPTLLRIDTENGVVSFVSNGAWSATFRADGKTHDRLYGGVLTRVDTTVLSNELSISMSTPSFQVLSSMRVTALNEGNRLEIIRNLSFSDHRKSIQIRSFFDRIAFPKDELHGPFAISVLATAGLIMDSILETEISTSTSKKFDPFRLTVENPGTLKGSVVHGYVSDIERNEPGSVTMRLRLQSIVLPDGQAYPFTGAIELKAGSPPGVSVDTEMENLPLPAELVGYPVAAIAERTTAPTDSSPPSKKSPDDRRPPKENPRVIVGPSETVPKEDPRALVRPRTTVPVVQPWVLGVPEYSSVITTITTKEKQSLQLGPGTRIGIRPGEWQLRLP